MKNNKKNNLVDGRSIAEKIYESLALEIKQLNFQPQLAIINFRPQIITSRYLKVKKERGEALKIKMKIEELADFSFKQAQDFIKILAERVDINGIIIQLPLPDSWSSADLLKLIPATKDPDCLSGFDNGLISPVAQALLEIFKEYEINVRGQKVAIIGAGILVGQPVQKLLKEMGAETTTLIKGDDLLPTLAKADIIISGAGSKYLIKPNMIKPQSILIDAGLSESAGSVWGDIDPICAEQARLFSGAKNGLGPIVIASLYSNFIKLLTK